MDSGPPEIRQNTQTQTDTHVLTPLMEETNKLASLSLIPRLSVSFPDPWSHSQTLGLIPRLSVSFSDSQSHSQTPSLIPKTLSLIPRPLVSFPDSFSDSQSHSQTLGLIPRLILRLSVSFPDTQSHSQDPRSHSQTLSLIPKTLSLIPRLSQSRSHYLCLSDVWLQVPVVLSNLLQGLAELL